MSRPFTSRQRGEKAATGKGSRLCREASAYLASAPLFFALLSVALLVSVPVSLFFSPLGVADFGAAGIGVSHQSIDR